MLQKPTRLLVHMIKGSPKIAKTIYKSQKANKRQTNRKIYI